MPSLPINARRFAAFCLLIMLFVWPVIVGTIFLVWIIYKVGVAYYYQSYLGQALERDLGFRHGAHYPMLQNPFCRLTAIESVAEDGVFAKAGFRAGDVLPDVGWNDLFKQLHVHRGQTTELAVVNDDTGVAVENRLRRVITFAVPPANRPAATG